LSIEQVLGQAMPISVLHPRRVLVRASVPGT